jgi:hypothetical protein
MIRITAAQVLLVTSFLYKGKFIVIDVAKFIMLITEVE